jgi:hypothetical protein
VLGLAAWGGADVHALAVLPTSSWSAAEPLA